MEWLFILGTPIAIVAILCFMSIGYVSLEEAFEMGVVFIFISIFFNFFIGTAFLTPKYEVMEVKIEKLETMSVEGKDYYYFIDLQNKEIIISKGLKQEAFPIESIKNNSTLSEEERNKIGEPRIETTSYTWDDNKFPYNLFITRYKSAQENIYLPKDSGYILPQ